MHILLFFAFASSFSSAIPISPAEDREFLPGRWLEAAREAEMLLVQRADAKRATRVLRKTRTLSKALRQNSKSDTAPRDNLHSLQLQGLGVKNPLIQCSIYHEIYCLGLRLVVHSHECSLHGSAGSTGTCSY